MHPITSRSADRRAFRKLYHAFRYLEAQAYKWDPEKERMVWTDPAALAARTIIYRLAHSLPGNRDHWEDRCARCKALRAQLQANFLGAF